MSNIRRKEEHEAQFLELNAVIDGKVTFSTPLNLRVNGKFDGELVTKGTLVIAKNAVVHANITGENIVVEGRVNGHIHASKELVLGHNSHVHADIEAVRFSIESGAVFNGASRMLPRRMSVVELCEYLSVEEDKLLKWVNSGQIPAQKTGSEIFFDHKEVETWLAQHT